MFLLPILILISNFAFTESDIQCYQCNSTDETREPPCDQSYWLGLTVPLKEEFAITCPYDRTLCVKRVVRFVNGTRWTWRGCNPRCEDWLCVHYIDIGCAHFEPKGIVTSDHMCLCDRSLCNHGYSATHNILTIWTMLLLFSLKLL